VIAVGVRNQGTPKPIDDLPPPKSKEPLLKEKENQKGSHNFATICPPQQACDALFNQIQPYNDYLSIYSFIFSNISNII